MEADIQMQDYKQPCMYFCTLIFCGVPMMFWNELRKLHRHLDSLPHNWCNDNDYGRFRRSSKYQQYSEFDLYSCSLPPSSPLFYSPFSLPSRVHKRVSPCNTASSASPLQPQRPCLQLRLISSPSSPLTLIQLLQ